MTRTISAIYENGVFRPTEPVQGLPEHSAVSVVVEAPIPTGTSKRAWGLQRDAVLYISPDFDAELGDEFWFGEDE